MCWKMPVPLLGEAKRRPSPAKRVLDIGLAAFGLVLLSPVIILLACIIRLTLGAPVLFRQERPGLHGKPFSICKFRTMGAAVDRHGKPLADEQRLGTFGRILRASSLDEVPELWNVLIGDMSMVGPRPLLMHYLPLYTPQQARRHEVRPGMTGWAQVNGRNAITWEQKFEHDVWYVDNHSLKLDLRILLLTVGGVLSATGISQKGHATAREFRGSSR